MAHKVLVMEIIDGRKVDDMEKFIAHIQENTGKIQWLEAHSEKVAQYAGESVSSVGLYNTAYLTGLFHDMGKGSQKYQEYLKRAAAGENVVKGSVIHTFTGVVYLLERYGGYKDRYIKLTCEIICYAIGAHHGIFDCVSDIGADGFLHRLNKDRKEICYEEAKTNFFEECIAEQEVEKYFSQAVEEIKKIETEGIKAYTGKANEANFSFGMIARLILSAVIEGDRRDTAEFMNNLEYPSIIEDMKDIWNTQLQFLENRMLEMPSDGAINSARSIISQKAKEFAIKGRGIYRLSVPTGSGKTLTSLRYALSHAKEYNKKRIFFIIPLLSVIEQNAKVIRDFLANPELVLEHHSNVVITEESPEELDKYEFAQETWKSPIVVSTLVQLLNTLFLGKTTTIRRMNSLADSIIVIDEVQSIPKNMISIFNTALNFLCYGCNATIILCSATQPCLEEVEHPIVIDNNVDIVPFEPELWNVFKRTKIVNKCIPGGYTIEQIANFACETIGTKESLLIICNTKDTARNIYNKIKDNFVNSEMDIDLHHLSTSMCAEHRIDTLEKINKNLGENRASKVEKRKTICIATQLVEAGIDFSFECVARISAGLDNIAQAAGRCNRNGEFGYLCDVYIINCKEESLRMLKEIAISQSCTNEFLYRYEKNSNQFDENMLSENAIKFYYNRLYCDVDISKNFDYPVSNLYTSLYEMLAGNNDFKRRNEKIDFHYINQAFKTAGKEFKVFDDATTDVIVPYNDNARRIIKELLSEKAKYDIAFLMDKISESKGYTISLYKYQYEKLKEKGAFEYNDGLPYEILLDGYYDREIGLNINKNIFLSI